MTEAIHAVATIIGSQVVLVSFGILFGGGVLGIAIGQMLPKHYLGEETLAMVRAAMGTLSILSALVLGFLINSAKTKFELVSVQIEQFAICRGSGRPDPAQHLPFLSRHRRRPGGHPNVYV